MTIALLKIEFKRHVIAFFLRFFHVEKVKSFQSVINNSIYSVIAGFFCSFRASWLVL